MKCGTTTLYSYLVQHPEIAANRQSKEPNFFSYRSAAPDLDDYFRQWLPAPHRRQIALEASGQYSKVPIFPDVASRLAEFDRKKYILYIVRDPVERIESHIAHRIAAGRWPFPERVGIEDLEPHIAVSSYHKQLSHYETAMPDVPLKVLDLRRLRDGPSEVLADVCRFLTIDDEFQFSEIGARNVRRSANDAKRFKLTPELRAALRERLAPDMHRFAERYDFDVSDWGF